MKPVELERLSPYLFIHMKNVQIIGRTHPVFEFEDMVVMNSELKTNMESK
jgi:hypothetical protein